MSVPAEFSPSFFTAAEPANGQVVFHVGGEIDIATSGQLEDAMVPHLEPQQTMFLDLSAVDFMDSSVLHVIERAQRALAADGGTLVLRNPSRAARRLLIAADAQHLLDAIEPAPS